MIDKKELMKELDLEFLKLKKEFNLTYTLEDIDFYFSIKNAVLTAGFIPVNLPSFISALISQHYKEWHSYLNGLLLPNSNYYANQTEAKLFSSESDKKLIWNLIKKTMIYTSTNSIIVLTNDRKIAGEFINSSTKCWVEEFQPKVLEILRRVNDAWRK